MATASASESRRGGGGRGGHSAGVGGSGDVVDDLDERLKGTPLKNEDPKRFESQRKLADTLQGRVWLAIDHKSGKPCIVKQASRHLIILGVSRQGVKVPEDFPAEIRTHMHLCRGDVDPGVVRALAWWTDKDNIYMAAEHCAGGELFDLIKNSGVSGLLARDIQRAAGQAQRTQSSSSMTRWLRFVQMLFQNIVKATHFIHAQNVAHLDMSLENTMVAEKGSAQAKIIDFGVAQHFLGSDFSRQGRVGKVGYMAPEVLAGAKFDARAADIWCLGVMLFMMVVGAPPFPKATPMRRGSRPTVFDYVIRGRLEHVLQQWKRLPLVTPEALDLLNRIFRYEKDRITMDGLMKHPFVGLGDLADRRRDGGGAADGIELGEDAEMEDAPTSHGPGASSSASSPGSDGMDARAEGEEVGDGEAGGAGRVRRAVSRSVRPEPAGARATPGTDADGDTVMAPKEYTTETARSYAERWQGLANTDQDGLKALLEDLIQKLESQSPQSPSHGGEASDTLSAKAIDELTLLKTDLEQSIRSDAG